MKRMLSGIKPTGRLTLGNYIGAIRNFVAYQDDYEMYVFIANMHAITVPQERAELKKNTKDLIALYLAAGLDPKKPDWSQKKLPSFYRAMCMNMRSLDG